MVILNQFEVTVPIDGKACEEVANEHTMDFGSVYIETVPGAHFEIQLAINPGFNFGRANYLRWEIFLNGESAVKSLCYRTEYQRDDCWRGSRGSLKERRDGRWYEKKFRFEDARIRENEPHDTDDLIRALKEVVWTIKVVIPRRIRRQNPEAQRDPAQTIGSVPLKAVKGQAITMSSTFGDAQPTEFITYHEGEDVDARPAATFVFKYRTKEALKQLRVILRTPSPVPLEERPVGDSMLEELRELETRQRDEKEVARRTKREGHQQETRPAPLDRMVMEFEDGST